MLPLKVINLYGAPGMGKSAVAAGLFWLIKTRQASIEHITEYAKYLILSDRKWQLERDQLYVVAKQHHKMEILKGHYDFSVTDSPLALASFYATAYGIDLPNSFHQMTLDYVAQYQNIDFFLSRDLSKGGFFENTGRLHDRNTSMALEPQQREWLKTKNIQAHEMAITDTTPWDIVDAIEKQYPLNTKREGPARPVTSSVVDTGAPTQADDDVTVINLYGAPGMGKSAVAAGLFWLLKTRQASIEHVTEYAKYLILSNRKEQLNRQQFYVAAKQYHKMDILRGHYSLCVTDSPLLLTSFYPDYYKVKAPPSFHQTAFDYAHSFKTINFFLSRNLRIAGQYETTGRNEDMEQSLAVETAQRQWLKERNIQYVEIPINDVTPWIMAQHLEQHHQLRFPRLGPIMPNIAY